MTDEFSIRRAAQHLRVLMVELDSAKHMRGKTVEEIVSGGAGFGPRTPGNSEAISLHAEIERELSIWLRDWATGRHGANDQLGWVAFNAEWVSQQPDSESLLSELNRWAGQVERAVGRGPSIKDLAKQATRTTLATASTAAKYATAQTGKRIDRKQVTYWGRSGRITVTHLKGIAYYSLNEVVECANLYKDQRTSS